MDIVFTIIISILVFGFLIFIHEFGHYIFARIFKVTIEEFSIGMGPKLVAWKSKKTNINYAISAIPIGGYVAMVGEDEDSDDPNSFDRKPAWQRFIITVAGATVNLIAGVIAVLVIAIVSPYGGTTVAYFVDPADTGYTVSTEEQGLMSGDTIIEVEGKRVFIADELTYEIMRRGNEPLDITVLRDGSPVTLENISFPTAESSGQVFGTIDFRLCPSEKTVGSTLTYAFSKSILIIRMCWESIYDLITGRYSVEAISGPIGISGAIGDAAKAGFISLLSLVALISINLGVMNLLPLPALDGGRIVMILIEMISRKRIPRKVEFAINGVGLALLLGLSVIIMIKDTLQLIF